MTIKQRPSLSTLATDPLRNFKWQVQFTPAKGKAVVMGFMTVSGLGINIDVIPYREGGYNVTTQKMPGQADFNPITMSKGVILGQSYDITWIKKLFDVMQGTGTQSATDDFRGTIDVSIIAHPVTTSTAPAEFLFRAYKAWPANLAWGDLDAGANQAFVRQVAFAHEGISTSESTKVGKDAPAIRN